MVVKEIIPINRLPIAGFLVNGVLTLIVLLSLFLSAGKTIHELVTTHSWALSVALILAWIAGWRSRADMIRLLIGKRRWSRPAWEGFLLGFFPIPAFNIFGIVQNTFAAGPPWPQPGYASLTDWLCYSLWMLCGASVSGIAAMAYALLFSGINRLLLLRAFAGGDRSAVR